MIRFLFVFLLSVPVVSFASAPVALVYDGFGVCPEDCAKAAAEVAHQAGYDVRFVNEHWWRPADFADASIYVQPGGHSAEVAQALSHTQKEELRRFVREGGGYVGLCAGAFFASARTRLEDGSFINDERLGLIPMISQWLKVPTDAAILPVKWNGVSRDVYWEGGPYFRLPVPAGVEVVATYPDSSIASVRTTYGRGRVYVTGFHPEAPQWWRDDLKQKDTDGLDLEQAADMYRWVGRTQP